MVRGATLPLPLFDAAPEASTSHRQGPADGQVVRRPFAPSASQPLPQTGRQALWLAIYLPKISLEVVREEDHNKAVAVIVQQRGRDLVHSCSPEAERKGIRPGMKPGAAYSLCPELIVHRLDKTARREKLRELATEMQRFTSQITLCADKALLLEVAGSLSYFGSLDVIRAGVVKLLSRYTRHGFHLAVSPTPAASLLLARAGVHSTVHSCEALRSALGDISVACLPLDRKRKQRLISIGARVLSDIWRLPTDQLAKRFGVDFVHYLKKVLGESFDARETFAEAPVFETDSEFLYAISDLSLLMAPACELIDELCDFLQARDISTDRFSLSFFHEGQAASHLLVAASSPDRDPGRFTLLLETRLRDYVLAAPVISLRICAEHFLPCKGQTKDLFPQSSADGLKNQADHKREALLDQLKMQLGDGAVAGITVSADHRPEFACDYTGDYESTVVPDKTCKDKLRPCWLLDEPVPLEHEQGVPVYRGSLRLMSGPERIESGWWSGAGSRRDYYIGLDPEGAVLWLYRDLKQQDQWYLHGLFA